MFCLTSNLVIALRMPDTAPRRHRSARWVLPAIYCGSLAAFTIDLTAVNTLPFGVFYVPMVGSAFYLRDKRAEWALLAIACAMVFIGSFFPSMDADTIQLAINRALSIGAVLGTATLVHYTRPLEGLRDRSPQSPVLWERSGKVYYAPIMNLSGEVRFFLVAEPAGRAWNWTAWSREGAELMAGQGHAQTIQQAMRDAERAVGSSY